MEFARTPAGRVRHCLAICAFAVAALWTSRAVLESPTVVVSLHLPAYAVSVVDLKHSIAQVAYMSRAIWESPLNLFTGQMCYPTASGVTLGEHMLGEGLLGLPAHLVWDDPVATFNFVVAVRPLIGAVSMYALAYYWTGSFTAAWIAGFAFGFHPTRLLDRVHPSVVGNELIPAILLSLHLVFSRRRWRDVFVLIAVTALQLLESLYVLMQVAIAAGTYGTLLLWHYRRHIHELLPKLAVTAAALAALLAGLLGPYIRTRAAWGILQARAAIPFDAELMTPGHDYYPGTILLLLAVVGLLDRLRRPWRADGHDPRMSMTLIILIAVWFVLDWNIPWTEWSVPSLRTLLTPWIPGFDAGRAPFKALLVVAAPLALLAAYGVRALTVGIGPKARAIVAGVVGVAVVAEVFVPALAAYSFGTAVPDTAYRVRPPEKDVAVLRDLPPGAVLNYPFATTGKAIFRSSHEVLLAAYHERDAAVCRGSFRTPVQFELEAIAKKLPNAAAAQDLWVLGFRTIVFSGQRLADHLISRLSDRAASPRLDFIGEGEKIRVYNLVSKGSVTTDIAALIPFPRSAVSQPGKEVTLRFEVHSGKSYFRHPDPVQPMKLDVTWRLEGKAIQSTPRRAFLPLVLSPKKAAEVLVEDVAPTEPGLYTVSLAPPNEPNSPVGVLYVVLHPDGSDRPRSAGEGPSVAAGEVDAGVDEDVGDVLDELHGESEQGQEVEGAEHHREVAVDRRLEAEQAEAVE